MFQLKGIFSDSNNIFLWHESEDMNETRISRFSAYALAIFTEYTARAAFG